MISSRIYNLFSMCMLPHVFLLMLNVSKVDCFFFYKTIYNLSSMCKHIFIYPCTSTNVKSCIKMLIALFSIKLYVIYFQCLLWFQIHVAKANICFMDLNFILKYGYPTVKIQKLKGRSTFYLN